MKRSKFNILIVDDDSTQGRALTEAFQRAGYNTTLCTSSAQAITTAQRQEFHCMLVDCMLPKMNGVDLVEEISTLVLEKPKVFLFSGIFKDRSFTKDAMDRTGAQGFFTKPLDLREVLASVDDLFASASGHGEDEPAWLALYSDDAIADKDLVRLIENEGSIGSFHLPMLYRRVQQTRLTGELSLITSEGDLSTVCFHEGKVFSVRTPDKDSCFGGLAVGFGFVAPEDVLEALKDPTRKLLGQKLIESMMLSPHAIHVIMEEQLALRLSQTVQFGVVTLQWEAKRFPTPDYSLNPLRFDNLVADWAHSKIDGEWIRSNLLLWGSFRLEGEFHPKISGGITIDDLLASPLFDERQDLPYLFVQLMSGRATLGSRGEDTRNFAFLEHRLDKLLNDYQDQNYFQILGVGERAQALELNKAYRGLKEFFDPENLPPGCPPSIMVKCTKVFQYIEQAYKTLSDDHSRHRYVLTTQNKRAQEMLENEPIFRAAILELMSGHAKSASKKFESLLDKKLEFRDLRAYRIWAGLKMDRNFAELTLEQVPPEERHSAAFMMAQGVHHKTRGQIAKALEAFRTANVLDPRLSIARSELQALQAELERKGTSGTIVKEVTSVVENLFGKKRRGA